MKNGLYNMMRSAIFFMLYVLYIVSAVAERNARQNISTFDVFRENIRHNGHMRQADLCLVADVCFHICVRVEWMILLALNAKNLCVE